MVYSGWKTRLVTSKAVRELFNKQGFVNPRVPAIGSIGCIHAHEVASCIAGVNSPVCEHGDGPALAPQSMDFSSWIETLWGERRLHELSTLAECQDAPVSDQQ